MELRCQRKGSVSYGPGADFSLPHCFLKKFAGILSDAMAFVTSSASSTDWTSLTVSVNSDISGEAGALAALTDQGRGTIFNLKHLRAIFCL